jgi:hypothetical protein
MLLLLLHCRFNGKAWLKFEDENGLWGVATVSWGPSFLLWCVTGFIHATMIVVQRCNAAMLPN